MNINEIKIVADSSADVLELAELAYASVPLKIITSDKEYVDDENLDVEQMVEDLLQNKERSSTACPGTGEWLKAFGDAKYVFCVTITSTLSGSYNSAHAAKQVYEESYPDRRVCLIDSLSTGPEMKLILEKITQLALEGKSFEEICKEIKTYQQRTGLLFMLESLRNLANNGRVNRLIASAVGLLGIRVIGKASEQGDLQQLVKCRGEKKAIPTIASLLREEGYNGGKLRISHCCNEQTAKNLQKKLLEAFPKLNVECYHTRGLCSFYAEKGGLLIGFEKG